MASGTPDLPTCWSSMAVPNHAASIWWSSMPASLIASSKASTIRSLAFAAQRSPNFEQPMPRMTTLSLMPLAMARSLRLSSGRYRSRRGDRRRLPEVPHESTGRIHVLDAEHHAHRGAHVDLALVDVGEIGHHAAAALELDHPVVGGRVRAVREPIRRVRHDAGRTVGEGLVVLAVEGLALRVHTVAAPRILHRPALAASAADEAREHVAVAVEEAEGRALVHLGSHPALERHQVVEG